MLVFRECGCPCSIFWELCCWISIHCLFVHKLVLTTVGMLHHPGLPCCQDDSYNQKHHTFWLWDSLCWLLVILQCQWQIQFSSYTTVTGNFLRVFLQGKGGITVACIHDDFLHMLGAWGSFAKPFLFHVVSLKTFPSKQSQFPDLENLPGPQI